MEFTYHYNVLDWVLGNCNLVLIIIAIKLCYWISKPHACLANYNKPSKQYQKPSNHIRKTIQQNKGYFKWMVLDQESCKTINHEMEMYRNTNRLFSFDTNVQESKILMPSNPLEFQILILCFIWELNYVFFISYLPL